MRSRQTRCRWVRSKQVRSRQMRCMHMRSRHMRCRQVRSRQMHSRQMRSRQVRCRPAHHDPSSPQGRPLVSISAGQEDALFWCEDTQARARCVCCGCLRRSHRWLSLGSAATLSSRSWQSGRRRRSSGGRRRWVCRRAHVCERKREHCTLHFSNKAMRPASTGCGRSTRGTCCMCFVLLAYILYCGLVRPCVRGKLCRF